MFFFFFSRAHPHYCPSMHHSLKAYCATLNIIFSSVSVTPCLIWGGRGPWLKLHVCLSV
jgi:hypothetical protein